MVSFLAFYRCDLFMNRINIHPCESRSAMSWDSKWHLPRVFLTWPRSMRASGSDMFALMKGLQCLEVAETSFRFSANLLIDVGEIDVILSRNSVHMLYTYPLYPHTYSRHNRYNSPLHLLSFGCGSVYPQVCTTASHQLGSNRPVCGSIA